MPVSKACQSLADQLASARKSLENVQSSPTYLDHGKPTPGGKMEAKQLQQKIATLSTQLAACEASHPYKPFHDPCSADQDAVIAAQKVLESIQSSPLYLDHGKPTPGGKREAEEQIHKINELESKYDACLRKHDLDPDLVTTFDGTATLTTAIGGGHHSVSIQLLFAKYHHTKVTILSFPVLHIPLPQAPTSPTATVSQTGTGTGTCDPATGSLEAYISLDIDITDPLGSLKVSNLQLSTDNHGGHRIDAHGNLTLVGNGVADAHGWLPTVPDELAVTLTVTGKLADRP